MRWRALALISLGLNVLLAASWLLTARHPGKSRSLGDSAALAASTSGGKTNVLVRRQFFSWTEVESPDYSTYITNLRAIGCPEQTIRDIIIADVNSYYARRRATELVTPEQQWWRSDPQTNVRQVAAQKTRELEDERRALLSRLLGSSWEAADMVSLPRPTRPGIVLDGPVLGNLPAETKQALQEVSVHSQERLAVYLDEREREGKPADPVELARLRAQTRTDLQRLLTPSQLEEFLLRYSQEANNLRTEFGQLRYFDANQDEFRAIFRATDAIDQQLDLLAGNDAASAAQRKALEAQRENAIKIALGAGRYEEYRALHDPIYRDA